MTLSLNETLFHAYKGMIIFQYGPIAEAMVADVEAGRKTVDEFWAVIGRALEDEPCSECGRDG